MRKTIGIAGGGQLGRMLAQAAHGLGCKVVVLDPTPNSPAAQVADEQIVGDYRDADMIRALSEKADVLTYEIESVHAGALEDLVSQGYPVHPAPHTLSIIKDKLQQKTFLQEHGIPVADFLAVEKQADAERAASVFGYPFVLKARSGGFDGRGNAQVDSPQDIPAALAKLQGQPLYAERFVPFQKELAVVAARTTDGDIRVYPLVETVHRDHICATVVMPAPVSDNVAQAAHDLAAKVLSSFEGAGIFGIEMFLADGRVLVNEIAPRVHNSGHLTIEACTTSQFEQHIRAAVGLPLGDVSMKVPAACMINILGDRTGKAEAKGVAEAEHVGGVAVHIYGKMETKPQRKMGHITAVAATLEEARAKAEQARSLITM